MRSIITWIIRFIKCTKHPKGTSPWRWPDYWPKHVSENTANTSL